MIAAEGPLKGLLWGWVFKSQATCPQPCSLGGKQEGRRRETCEAKQLQGMLPVVSPLPQVPVR